MVRERDLRGTSHAFELDADEQSHAYYGPTGAGIVHFGIHGYAGENEISINRWIEESQSALSFYQWIGGEQVRWSADSADEPATEIVVEAMDGTHVTGTFAATLSRFVNEGGTLSERTAEIDGTFDVEIEPWRAPPGTSCGSVR